MFSFMKRIWRAAPIATIVLALALAMSVFFAVRTTASWIYWNDPAHIDQPIEGWMTARYIAYSWDIPRDVMVEALHLGQPGDGPSSLRRLADTRGVPLDVMIADLEAAIAVHRLSQADSETGGAQ